MDVMVPADYVSLSVPIVEMTGVGEARRLATKLATAHGFDEQDVGRVALVVTEAASNMVQHAGSGELLLRSWAADAKACCMEILALDHGPGMANVAACMRDGFSTGGSRGVGLGAIARLATTFEIFSASGKGAALLACIGERSADTSTGPGLAWGAVCVAKPQETSSGDAWAVREHGDRSTLLVVDGLGHGPAACDAAQTALRIFAQHEGAGPEGLLRLVHAALRGARGAAIAVAEIDWMSRQLRFAGVGNISGILISPNERSKNLVSHNGTAGHNIERIQEFCYPWPKEARLIMHSDGVGADWELEAYPGLGAKNPGLIAGVLYRDFADRHDDAVVLVARERL